jgi:hypothetical protein
MEVRMLSRRAESYVRPGNFELGITPVIERSLGLRCLGTVEVNPGGSGYSVECAIGDCNVVTASIPAGGTVSLEVRTTAEKSGRHSKPILHQVIADATAPMVAISSTAVLTATAPSIRGTAWDPFPAGRAPVRVEVSLDGGPFRPALLAAHQDGDQPLSWRLPLRLTRHDGAPVQVVARAVDEAGNVSRHTAPVAITLDRRGPRVSAQQEGQTLAGTIRDGSGVAALELSLDGGRSYQSVPLAGSAWQFNLAAWLGDVAEVALLRARDLHGNRSQAIVPISPTTEPTEPPHRLVGLDRSRVFLPYTGR